MSRAALCLVVGLVVAPVAGAAEVDWSGPYLGLFGGYADANDAWDTGPTGSSLSPEGFMVGGFAGYAHDAGGLVLGLETDLVFPDFSDEGSCSASPFECELDVQVMSSLRGRAGVAVGPVLLYGTAGVALGFLQADSSQGLSDSKALAGWTAGAGIEWQSEAGVRFGVEYRHSDYGESDVTFGGGTQGEIALETDDVRLRFSIPLN